MKRRKSFAAISALGAIGAVLVSAAPAQAAECYPDGDLSYTYDYAWITDHEDECGYMAVRHHWVQTGNAKGWTAWVGGTQHHYQTPKVKNLDYAGWLG